MTTAIEIRQKILDEKERLKNLMRFIEQNPTANLSEANKTVEECQDKIMALEEQLPSFE